MKQDNKDYLVTTDYSKFKSAAGQFFKKLRYIELELEKYGLDREKREVIYELYHGTARLEVSPENYTKFAESVSLVQKVTGEKPFKRVMNLSNDRKNIYFYFVNSAVLVDCTGTEEDIKQIEELLKETGLEYRGDP